MLFFVVAGVDVKGGTCSLVTSPAFLTTNPHRAHHEAARASAASAIAVFNNSGSSSHSYGSASAAPLASASASTAPGTSPGHHGVPVHAVSSSDLMKRDLEHQLALVERDRRTLELELRETLGARRTSEDRVTKYVL